MTTDDTLKAWRDAAVEGGFPEPRRRRWQPLRAGVVNLWEFEAVEYWYADGWAQLMGRNETGKSSLMALTTLIPWLGDTSSDKIDTLGRSGKQFSYYVRPTGSDGDRRDASGSHFHGWLWVEYGRLTDDGPRYFTTLLYASARSATPRVHLEWCTAEGARVRDNLLLTRGREIQTPKNIDAPGFLTHPSAAVYKAESARHLLGSTVDKLEIVGKILKVTRTPKLGAHLDVRFVTDHLRASLPELRRSEIEQLAQGWDQLDQVRHDLQRTQDAADTVARFAGTTWRAWLGARLRIVADDAAESRTKFDNVRRDEDAATRTLHAAEAEDSELAAAIDATALRAEAASAAVDELRQSAAYRDAQSRIEEARRADEAVHAAERERDRTNAEVRRAEEDVRDLDEEVADHRRVTAQLSDDFRAAQDRARSTAEAAGMPTPETELDVVRLRQRATERREHHRAALRLLRQEERANADATRLGEIAVTIEGIADDAATEASTAWEQAQASHDVLVEQLSSWARSVPEPPETATWADALPRATADLDSPTLVERVRAEWFEPLRARSDDARLRAVRARDEARAAADATQAEITELEGADIQPPAAPTLWHRRDRSRADGAPLWRLLNPTGDLPTESLSRIEAAMAASGLLDAWVTADGLDGLDTFATAADEDAPGQRLGAVLRVADDAGHLGEVAQRVLDGVALRGDGEPLPTSGLAIATDGRWRSSSLTGTAAPRQPMAEWLGEAAREAQRRRRLSELGEQLRENRAAEARHAAAVVTAEAELDALQDALQRLPSDQSLRGAITTAQERQRKAETDRERAAEAARRAAEARTIADSRRAELLRYTTDHRLPATADGLDDLSQAMHDLDRRLDNLEHTHRALTQARAAEERIAERLTRAEQHRDEQITAHRGAERSLGVSRARAEALHAAIGADDAAVLARLEQLQTEAREAVAQRTELSDRRIEVGQRLGGARARLERIQADRDEARRERDRTFSRFRSLIDRGVARELSLDLPEPDSSAIEHVRDQVAEVRRLITPRRWQPGAREANERQLQALRSALEANARETSSELEQGGRSLKLEPVDDDLVRIDVTVDTNGKTLPLSEAVGHLAGTVATLREAYDTRVQETLDELLGSTFLEHMRERIGTALNLIREINQVLGQHATTTSGTALRIRLEADQNRGVLDAVSGSALQDPQVQEQVRDFLRSRVDEAKRLAEDRGDADWHDALAQQLDYRQWYDVVLQRRIGAGGSWSPLTTRSFAEMSGGARAVMLMLPLVATLAALYRDMPNAPRPIWLDEAFDGLDVPNRSMVMDLLRQFDLDVLLAGPGRLVNVDVVPAAAIYQVVRAPAPMAGADLTLELWAGGTLEMIDLPLSWLDAAAQETDHGQDALL